MGVRKADQKTLDRMGNDVQSGKVQDLIDQGWTLIQIARKYDVSESYVRRLGATSGGPLRFKKGRGGSLKQETVSPDKWSDAKRLAMGSW